MDCLLTLILVFLTFLSPKGHEKLSEWAAELLDDELVNWLSRRNK